MAGVTRRGDVIRFDLRTEPPLRDFQFDIDRFTEGITDWTVPLTACGELFKRQMMEVFASEGQASGEQWKALSDNPKGAGYATWKEENYPGMPIGVLTGALMESMTGGEGWSMNVDKTRADYGMDPGAEAADYGEYFAEERPVVRLPQEWAEGYRRVIQTWLIANERSSMGFGGAAVPGMVRAGGIANIDWTVP
jgi:hypothetical protein